MTDTSSKPKGKPVEFPIPENFTPPESNEAPGEFEAVCEFRIKPDGKTMCLLRIGDTELPEPKDYKHEKAPDYKGVGGEIVGAMQQGNPGMYE